MSTPFLREVDIKPVADVVEKLREILARAERGETLGFVIATVDRERQVSTAFTKDVSVAEALYAVTLLRMRLERMVE